MSEFNFMQITGYSLEVNGLKQERTTHRCLRSFNCYRNDFNFPVSFWVVLWIMFSTTASINGHKIRQGRSATIVLMRHWMTHTDVAVFIVLLELDFFENMIEWPLQTVRNVFPMFHTAWGTLNREHKWLLRSGGHLCRYVALTQCHITRVTLCLTHGVCFIHFK